MTGSGFFLLGLRWAMLLSTAGPSASSGVGEISVAVAVAASFAPPPAVSRRRRTLASSPSTANVVPHLDPSRPSPEQRICQRENRPGATMARQRDVFSVGRGRVGSFGYSTSLWASGPQETSSSSSTTTAQRHRQQRKEKAQQRKRPRLQSESPPPSAASTDDGSSLSLHSAAMRDHLSRAASAPTRSDVDADADARRVEVEGAERALLRWVDEAKGLAAAEDPPGAEAFEEAIGGWLSVPSWVPASPSSSTSPPSTNGGGGGGDPVETVDGLHFFDKSDRASHLLDVMETFHEPTQSAFDPIVASHGSDALECLRAWTDLADRRSQIFGKQRVDQDWDPKRQREQADRNESYDPEILEKDEEDEYRSARRRYYYRRAWKSAEAALDLLDRAEELHREFDRTEDRPSLLPSVRSYVTMLDVWKALAVAAKSLDDSDEEDDTSTGAIAGGSDGGAGKAVDVVRKLQRRRFEAYSLEDDGGMETSEWGGEEIVKGDRRRYSVLHSDLKSHEKVLEFSRNLLMVNSPSYRKREAAKEKRRASSDSTLRARNHKIGTWHFNQLIFDLTEHPVPFSAPLAQDLLVYMVDSVRKAAVSSPRRRKRAPASAPGGVEKAAAPIKNDIVPKPNVDTINGVLKAWMVASRSGGGGRGGGDASDDNSGVDTAPRMAEAVLARLAAWQDSGVLWGVTPDIVSYNTVMNCWKEGGGGTREAAERCESILHLLEETEDAAYADEDDAVGEGERASDGREEGNAVETVINVVAPDVVSYATCIGAWAKAASRGSALGAGRRAEATLNRMIERSRRPSRLPGRRRGAKPTVRCFNAVLLAYGREPDGGKRALDLLRFMEQLHAEDEDGENGGRVKPDTYTFNIVMKALANCRETGAAERAMQLLMRMEELYSRGDGGMEPDLLSYNTVLDALAKNGDAESAEKLLRQMYLRSETGPKSGGIARPNTYSYTAVLNAWSRSEDKSSGVDRAEDIFNDLEKRYAAGETDVRADTSVYNALINCWAKSGERSALYRVTQILDLMEELGLQGGDSDVKPNSRTYCAVLDTLARSGNWKASKQAVEIIERMEQFYADGVGSVRPCARAYSIVISTIARSKEKGKALKAQEILHQMESEYRKGNVAARPTVYSYNGVLNAAAYTVGEEREQEEAFKVACLTFDELRMSDSVKPSHVSYGSFLGAMRNLMPKSQVRDDLVKSVFRRCCRDGQVGDLVLRNTKSLASPELYQSLLEGVADYGLPKSWSANVY